MNSHYVRIFYKFHMPIECCLLFCCAFLLNSDIEYRYNICVFFFFKQKTAYEIGTGDWSSDVCSSDLVPYLEMGGSDGFLFRN